MRVLLILLAWLALAGTIVPSCLFLLGGTDLPAVKTWMLIAMIVWFVAASGAGALRPAEPGQGQTP